MGSGPTVPNANDLSDAQSKSNIKSAVAQQGLNSVNQTNPFGSLNYSQNGTWPDGTPRFNQTTTFNPQLQGLFDQQMRNQGTVGQIAGQQAGRVQSQLGENNPLPQYQQYGSGPQLNSQGGTIGAIDHSIGNAAPINGQIQQAGPIQQSLGGNDFSADRQNVQDTLLGQLNQQSDRDRGSLEQRLASQGLSPGTEAYTNAMRDFNNGLSSNRTSAILGAGQEQNRLQSLALNAGNFANSAQAQQYGQNANNAQFGLQAQGQGFNQQLQRGQFSNDAQNQLYQQTLGNAGFGNQANQQMYQNQQGATQLNNGLQDSRFNNMNTRNNTSLNQLLALQGGSQVQQPQFGQSPQSGVAGTDVSGNAWNQYNAQQGQQNQFYNGLGSLLGTIGGFAFSDKRLKEDITDTGMKTPGGVPIKDWRYKGSPMMQRGYVAQDVMKRQPEAVAKGPGGFLAVNYRRVK